MKLKVVVPWYSYYRETVEKLNGLRNIHPKNCVVVEVVERKNKLKYLGENKSFDEGVVFGFVLYSSDKHGFKGAQQHRRNLRVFVSKNKGDDDMND